MTGREGLVGRRSRGWKDSAGRRPAPRRPALSLQPRHSFQLALLFPSPPPCPRRLVLASSTDGIKGTAHSSQGYVCMCCCAKQSRICVCSLSPLVRSAAARMSLRHERGVAGRRAHRQVYTVRRACACGVSDAYSLRRVWDTRGIINVCTVAATRRASARHSACTLRLGRWRLAC